MNTKPDIKPEDLAAVMAFAAEFDRRRSCWWNSMNHACRYDDVPEFHAGQIPEFASLGGQCYGTLLELAMCHTLRPCKACGSDHLYKSNYQIACCSCFGDVESCEERKDDEEDGEEGERCCCSAENMNLPDAITLWNLQYADDGPVGRVVVCG